MFWFSPKIDNQGTFGWRFTFTRRVAGANTGGGGLWSLSHPLAGYKGCFSTPWDLERKSSKGKILKILISVAKFKMLFL